METIFEDNMLRTGPSSKKRRQENVASGEGNVPKKRRKAKSSRKNVDPLGEMARREEERLEKLVLGDGSDLLQDDSELPSCSYPSMEDSGVEEGDYSSSPQMSDTLASPERQLAWIDEDDENICVTEAMGAQGRRVPEVLSGGTTSDSYTQILKHKFEATVGTPAWAQLGHRNTRKGSSSDDDDSDSDSELLRHCGNFLSSRSSSLRKNVIQVKRMRDLNNDTYSEGPIIKAVKFHPSATVGLVAGLSGIASLFQVDGRSNTKLQSIQFEQYPINCAHFTPSGEQFMVGSQHHNFFHMYDMMAGRSNRLMPGRGLGITHTKNFEISPDGRLLAICGRFGNIHLLTAQALEQVGLLKMNDDVSAVAFDGDGTRLFSHGAGGEVYAWDVGSRRCLGRFIDDGSICGKSLTVAPGGRYLAAGSRSGVVNVYETERLMSSGTNAPSPLKIFLNLTTSATTVKFNPASEILAMASYEKDNALRLVHFPSMTVFSNFPGSAQPLLSRPQCLDFSPNSGYLAVGNNKNTALLYRQVLRTILMFRSLIRRMVIASVLAFFSLFSKAMAAARERTFLMVKPDGVQRGLVGKIIKRLEAKGFKLVAMKFVWADEELLKKHYADLSSRPFFPGLVKYMSSGPVVPMVSNNGVGRNIIHGSDSVESANKEINLWFDSKELIAWKPAVEAAKAKYDKYYFRLGRFLGMSGLDERTLIVVTPDGVQRGLIGRIVQRFEDRGFRLLAIKFVWPTEGLMKAHYAEHSNSPIFSSLIKSMTSGPVVPMVWEGQNVIRMGRAMLGATDPKDTSPGTVRGDLSLQVSCRNVMHGSDSPESAKREIDLWFRPGDL
ncbi:hypothetical protein C0J52_05510, partial [Blattella germanica]